MRGTYWDRFMLTGSVEDYLNYKMEEEQDSPSPDRRKEHCESDRTYRDGALHSPGWRI